MNNKNYNLCLNYHDFSGTKAESFVKSKYTVPFESFKKQLDLLCSLKNVTLSNLLYPTEGFTYSLTFDDGYKSILYIAEELAKRYIKGTFFIIKNKSINDNKYLDTKEIKELDSLGMEIGSHSCTHRHLNRLSEKEMLSEIHDSKLFLEDILSKPINSIAFPGGHFGKREINACLAEGYLLNRTVITGLNRFPLEMGIVKCITITDKVDINTFKKILNLSPLFFTKVKLRELALSLPKYIESRYIARNY